MSAFPVIVFCFLASLAGGIGFAQEAPAAGDAPTTATIFRARDRANTFLDQLEAHHAATTALHGKFAQVRVDQNFLEEVKSNGEFSYKAPNRFRADYTGRKKGVADSTVYIVDDRMWHYVAEIKQVDVVDLPRGDAAAINQMLLGFGVKKEKILQFFNVQLDASSDDKRTVLIFDSKDKQRTLNYQRITITFDTQLLTPQTLVLEDADSQTTMTLSDVELNPKLKDEIFRPDFPKDVEIVERHATRGFGALEEVTKP
jgi:outer membrane lipoprotein-sorting protein